MPPRTKKKQTKSHTNGANDIKHKRNTEVLLTPPVGTVISLLVSALLYFACHHYGSSSSSHVERAIVNESECRSFGSCPVLAAQHDHVGNFTNAVPDECTLVMAPSSIENGGWGVFTLVNKKKDELALGRGDILIHLPDPNPHHAPSMGRLIWEYLWDGTQMHGHYEGRYVLSVVPGMGMLVNSVPNMADFKFSGKCTVDNAGLSRGMVGEGAVSHHHDCKWRYDRDVGAGKELFVEYERGWFEERGFEFNEENEVVIDMPQKRSGVEQLKRVGYCLDNLVPGKSVVKGAGRGAFASCDIHDGSVIAPVPGIPLSSSSLDMVRAREDGSIFTSTQLLHDYCFGHPVSSLLLFPYSQSVNLINHDLNPNVKLWWWSGSVQYFNKTFLDLQQSPSIQLMLELVATCSIEEGEELYLDYGQEWEDAWNDHVEEWIHYNRGKLKDHLSSEEMNNDKSYSVIRTVEELKTDPYQKDVFMSCYIQYTTNKRHQTSARTMTEWKNNHEVKSSWNLCPCIVLARELDAKSESDYRYTVCVMNHPMLKEDEKIPKGYEYIVTNLPRHAIIFSDKKYSSDQHLESAFCKEMSLGDLFPMEWKNLLGFGIDKTS